MTPSTRIWGIVSGAAAVAVLAGGWFLGVQPQLAAAAAANDTAASVQTQNQATRIKLAGLTRAAAKSDAMRAENELLLKAVPSILKPNTFIRRVMEVGALDDVDIVSINPGAASAYAPPVAASAGAGLALGKTDPLITGGNFTVVPVTLMVSGDSDAIVQFIHDIQNDERTFAINSVQTSKDGATSATSASLIGYIYVLKR